MSNEVARTLAIEIVQAKGHFLILVVAVKLVVARVVHVATSPQFLDKCHCGVSLLDILGSLAHYHLVEHDGSGHEFYFQVGVASQWHLNLLSLIPHVVHFHFIKNHTCDYCKAPLVVS